MVMNFYPNLKVIAGPLRVIINLGIIFVLLTFFKLRKSKLNKIAGFYVLYLFVLSLFSSDFEKSILDGFLKVGMSVMMIPVGIKLGSYQSNLLIKPMIWVAILLILNYFLSQIFQLGISNYDADSFYSGGATASAPVILALVVLLTLNAYNLKELPYKKIFIFGLIAIIITIILISMKRGAIVALFLGIIVYVSFSSKRKKLFAVLTFLLLLAFVVFNQFSDVFSKRLNSRTTERNSIENESRYMETFYVFEELENFNLVNLSFGKEAFNSEVPMRKYFGRARQLHVDYNIILHGTGILGLLFYFYLFKTFYNSARDYKKKGVHFFDNPIAQQKMSEHFSLIISIIALSLTMSLSGGLQFVSYRIMLFLTLGFFIGQMHKTLKTTTVKIQ